LTNSSFIDYKQQLNIEPQTSGRTETVSRKPRNPSTYEVVYEDPKPAPNARSGGVLFTKLQEVVTDNKGAWARIVECNSRSGANSILNRINKEKSNLPAPREQFKFTCRTDSDSNKSWLYVLFNEQGFEDENETPATPAKPARKPRQRKTAVVETAAPEDT
jgi:hypothetical protein